MWRASEGHQARPPYIPMPQDATKLPRDVATAHDAHHLTTNLIFDHGSPGNEAEAELALDHSEPSAGSLDRTQKLATDLCPVVNWMEAETATGRELAADAVHLLAHEIADQISFHSQLVRGSLARMPAIDQHIGAREHLPFPDRCRAFRRGRSPRIELSFGGLPLALVAARIACERNDRGRP